MPEPTPVRQSGTASREPRSPRGIRAVILGALLAGLAPLAGFLGGSMAGHSGGETGMSPLFLWMFGGLIVGAIGAVIAIMGALRWMRTRHMGQNPPDKDG
ncbi:hypothetical protein [Planobispora longispora]|uniref:Uncharacterized protein n=1 Tax=Planobispora longispora TaxID=28887 RepID=A0A8J3RUP9_9ACTN|nr:hypothetical protein [Planobispora longispora]GIH81503.1 hypothetical protein Plo01_79320 [Planobispora longispora]